MTSLVPHRRLFLLAAPSFMLASCSTLIGPPMPSQIYLLKAPMAEGDAHAKVNWSLAIAVPDASESLDNDRIALATSDTEFDYYANAVWADRLPGLVQTSFLAGFESTNRIDIVAREEGLFHADYRLLTDIRDFEARYTNPGAPPTVLVTIVAYVLDARSRKIVSSTTAAFTQASTANGVSAVVEAFDVALARVVTSVVDWALKLPGPAEPRA